MRMYINGENTGERTPFTFSNLERGFYNITLKLNLYDDNEFLIDLAKDIAIGAASGLIASVLYNKLQNCSWLKIGDKTSRITLEDIKKTIQEEFEKQKKNSACEECSSDVPVLL